jgi:hypothetical protein
MNQIRVRNAAKARRDLDGRLAAYLGTLGAVGTAMAAPAEAHIVSNQTVQPIGINGAVPIDFNSDGQVDFELDHDRVDVSGTIIDYLQIDKNDTNGASPGEDLLPINVFDTFDPGASILPNGTDTAAYVTSGTQGDYPAALTQGTPIGPASSWDFQEGTDFNGTGRTIRANRLIDEDAGQIDMALGGLTAGQIAIPTNGPNFLGLGGEVRYLGMRMEFASNDQTNYGWIGIRITNEADALGEVVGWGYQTVPGMEIAAGAVIPEPGSAILSLLCGVMLCSRYFWKKLIGR